MAAYPKMQVSQYVIVLGDGSMAGVDDPHEGFALGVNVIYLRDLDPAILLTRPGLAPLAVLAAGDESQRAASLRRAWQMISSSPPSQLGELWEAAGVLATIRLTPPTIDQIRKELNMTVQSVADFYSQTEVGQELIDRGAAQGRDEGREQGLQEGRDEGVRTTLTLLAQLQARFPGQPTPAGVLDHLISWHDPAAAALAIQQAEDPAHLLSVPPPQT